MKIQSPKGKIMLEMREMRETLESVNQTSPASNFKHFKPQTLRQILIFIRMTLSSEPVLNLIQE